MPPAPAADSGTYRAYTKTAGAEPLPGYTLIAPLGRGGFGKLVLGTRRQNLVYIDDLASAWEPDGLRLTFTLPAGSYATVLLAEVMKTTVADDGGTPDDDGEGEQ